MSQNTIIKTISGKRSISGFLETQKRNLLKYLIRVINRRSEAPHFWIHFNDTVCKGIVLHGYYELDLLNAIKALSAGRTKGIALDIGANIGNHTVYFSKIFTEVISFEPVQENCNILKANLRLNTIQNVTLVEKALGAKSESLKLLSNNPLDTNNGLLIRPENNTGQTGNLVEVVRGDDELRLLDPTLPIQFIKIDVEGFEPFVVQGLENTIKKFQPLICWEAFTHEDANKTKHILEGFGYKFFYHISTNKFTNMKINKLANSFGKKVYLEPLAIRKVLDGMNMASWEPLT